MLLLVTYELRAMEEVWYPQDLWIWGGRELEPYKDTKVQSNTNAGGKRKRGKLRAAEGNICCWEASA